MTPANRRTISRPFRRCALPLFNLIVASTWFLASAGIAHADIPDRLRLMTAVKKFSSTSLVAATYEIDAPRWLKAHRVEWSIGVFQHADDIRPFFAFGPVWRVQRPTGRFFFEFSFSPTVLTNPRLGDKTLGGDIHFTSALSIGREFADGWALSLRAQHISNGGLNGRNPGLDLIGVSIAKQFSD